MSDVPTVVLVHGGLWEDTDAGWFWRRTGVVAALERRGCAVLAPDRARRAASWQDEAGHLAAALAGGLSAGAGPVTLAGGSFGCAAAVRLALDHPGTASRLILAWPASVSDQFVAVRARSGLARQGARRRVIDALAGGGTLPSARDEELAALTIPVGVVPSVPANPVHPRSAVDALVRLLPAAVELPGCPEAPRPEFPPYLEAFADTVAAFARG